jgi:hypothetical protein
VVADYNQLAIEAERIHSRLAPEYRDAFFQLVLYPIKACANLNEMYVAAARNQMYAKQGRAATNELADRVLELFEKDDALTRKGNHEVAGGKWNHMYDQTHIGYTYWQEPPKNTPPNVEHLELPVEAEMGVAIEGSENWWPESQEEPALPELDSYGPHSSFIEIFNRGQEPLEYVPTAAEPWVSLTPSQTSVEKQQRVEVSVDWDLAPAGESRVPITIVGPQNRSLNVICTVKKWAIGPLEEAPCFVESGGYVSIEAEHLAKNSRPRAHAICNDCRSRHFAASIAGQR